MKQVGIYIDDESVDEVNSILAHFNLGTIDEFLVYLLDFNVRILRNMKDNSIPIEKLDEIAIKAVSELIGGEV